ncbi:DUF805 domain-containing protein [Blastococcus goldschmidtiae]|uniref:DUF805 domain-containing protein n=1 Tax=Blastococcus goldschmidtiae TaxID=3075546 RepID=A0ABU2K4H6_9ACTN|nr:DUF805 domain-containing protein [Blastococcus sp. DSM 46792]MDT0275080.1 DUF805 domain-containing protein [Blastococcus sp. DSM 46792]
MSVWDWYVRRGRLSRGAWWLQYLLPGVLLPILAGGADRALGLPVTTLVTETGVAVDDPTGPLQSTVAGLLAVPMISAFVARLHDEGYSAWRLLLALVPVVGALVLVVLVCFFSGDRLPNRYGPPPASWRPPRIPAVLRRRRVPA